LALEVSEQEDQFLILESKNVLSKTSLLINVLNRNGRTNISRVEISDIPSEIVSTLHKALNELSFEQIVFVANGGTKLAFAAITSAINHFPHDIVYGSLQPTYQRFKGSLLQPQTVHFFSNNEFDLKDIFTLNGCTTREGAQNGFQIWPYEQAKLEQERYGFDKEFTRHCHDVSFLREEVYKLKRSPKYSEITNVDPDFKQHWLKNVTPLLLALFKELASYCDIQTNNLKLDETFLSKTYDGLNQHLSSADSETYEEKASLFLKALINRLCGVLKDLDQRTTANTLELKKSDIVEVLCDSQELKSLSEWNRNFVLDVRKNRFSYKEDNFVLGPALENAVASRVANYLNANQKVASKVIHSVWVNVKSFRDEKINAEYDVLIVTRNARLIHLECKSFTATIKDLNARLLEMITSSSNLSQLYVCAPIYTDFSESNWFKRIVNFRADVLKTGNLKFCPFTFEEQSEHFNINSEQISVPLFEESLDKILTELIPSDMS